MGKKSIDDALNVADGLGTKAIAIREEAVALRRSGFPGLAEELDQAAWLLEQAQSDLERQLKNEVR